MKILIFTSVFPYPLNEGGKVAQFGFIEYLARKHDVILVYENNYEGLRYDIDELKKIIPAIRIRTLTGNTLVLPKGFLSQLSKIIEKIQWRLKKQINSKNKKALNLDNNNFFIYPVRPSKSEVIDQLMEICKIENPDLIQVDFIDNADIAGILPAHIPKVLVHHDLRFVSVKQVCELDKHTVEYCNYLAEYVRTIEMAFINKFNTVITFSEDDKIKLQAHTSDTKVVSIPFPVLDKNSIEIPHQFFIQKLIFIGPDHHLPNYDAVDWYVKEIAPLIWSKFKLKLLVIGEWSSANVSYFSKYEGIEFAGYVEDLRYVFQNSIMLVPLRIGSGIRTKLLDAFAFGAPVITTHIGCEGLAVRDNTQVLVAESPAEFFESLQMLIGNPDKVNALRNNANQFVRENFSQQTIYNKRMELYKGLLRREVVSL